MITITEKNGCQGFSTLEVTLLIEYLEQIYKYQLEKHYFVYEFEYDGEFRYSIYVKTGNRFSRIFTNFHTLQPSASFNLEDGSITGKRGTKQCAIKMVEGISYIADNYHPLYINQFVEVVE